MNHCGFVLNRIGFQQFLDDLCSRVIKPLTRIFFGEEASNLVEAHHSFTIGYNLHEDTQLADHKDISDVTLNICLGKQFTGSEVHFYGMQPSVLRSALPNTHLAQHQRMDVAHKPGYALLHFGHHVHGTNQLTSGSRWNIVVWAMTTKKLQRQLEYAY
jgi:hypothetical protein